LTDLDPDYDALSRRMVAMEEAAFCEFAKGFGPRFRAFFLNRGLSAAEAEDLAVSCVTDIALKVEKYSRDRGGRFEAWVFTLARHALMDWYRRRRVMSSIPEYLTVPEAQGEEAEPSTDLIDAVREAVSKLSEGDQVLVQFRHLGEAWSYADIAERLGIQPEAARVRHHRALRRLKSLLSPDPRVQRLLQREPSQGGKA